MTIPIQISLQLHLYAQVTFCFLCFLVQISIHIPSTGAFVTTGTTGNSYRTTATTTATRTATWSLLSATSAATEITTATTTTITNSPLSMSMDELASHLGGLGRARIAWDYYLLGVDPLVYFDNCNTDCNTDCITSIQHLLPSGRRANTLGKDALLKLANINGLIDGGIATLSHVSISADNTTKLLLKFPHDGVLVETVIIPWNEEQRSTLCISSQVGCRQACTFCATGAMGMGRNLTSDEMLAQVFFALRIIRQHDLPTLTHVVFMGMGEPSDNAAAVVKTAQQLTTRELFQLSKTKVTISTVAPTPNAFETLAQAQVMLAWSVHASQDVVRKTLVPTTRNSMMELRQGLIGTLQTRNPVSLRTVMLEVALIAGMNDRMEDADHLADFVAPILLQVPFSKVAVNLIPFNDIGHGFYKTPTHESVVAFQQRLWSHGVAAFVRTTRGDDEAAACGQLATTSSKRGGKSNIVV